MDKFQKFFSGDKNFVGSEDGEDDENVARNNHSEMDFERVSKNFFGVSTYQKVSTVDDFAISKLRLG